MAEATERLDLAPVMDVLEHYHRLAWTCTADPAGYRRMLDTAARVLVGEDVPPGARRCDQGGPGCPYGRSPRCGRPTRTAGHLLADPGLRSPRGPGFRLRPVGAGVPV